MSATSMPSAYGAGFCRAGEMLLQSDKPAQAVTMPGMPPGREVPVQDHQLEAS